MRRLAIYASPRSDSPLGRLAAGWLGRAIDSPAMPAARPTIAGLDVDEVTEDARRYGFHATLKPPFRLAEGVDLAAVDHQVARLASGIGAVDVPALVIDVLAGFVAFRPAGEASGLDELAAVCVRELDGLRRPPDDLELARRRRAGLSATQERHLAEWGYPYVFDEFRFHMTLSCRLRDAELSTVLAAARDWFGEVEGAPWILDELCIVEEIAPGEPFRVIARHPLAGPPGVGSNDPK